MNPAYYPLFAFLLVGSAAIIGWLLAEWDIRQITKRIDEKNKKDHTK